MARAHFLEPLLRRSQTGARALVIERLGTPLATTIITAFDSAGRKRGLLGRGEFPGHTAMVIAPCSAVHTWFMQFAIDVVFVARDGRVVKNAHAVAPWRMALAMRAFAAIELKAGASREAGLRDGDRLTVAVTQTAAG